MKPQDKAELERAVSEGQHVARFLEDPVIREVRERLIAGLRSRLENGSPTDTEYLMTCRIMLDTAKDFFGTLDMMKTRGHEAETVLEHSIQGGSERLRSIPPAYR